jgi:hypothetical protein
VSTEDDIKARLFGYEDPPPCIGGDRLCPCQDGDACHYRAVGDSPAMPIPGAEPEDTECRWCGEVEPCDDRGMCGVCQKRAIRAEMGGDR